MSNATLHTMLLGAALSVVATTPAAAAEPATAGAERTAGANLDEVVVTARRREESSQDVPVSISALSGDEMTKQSIVTMSDLQYHVPGLQFNAQSRSGSSPHISLRGLRQVDVTPSADPTVGVYFAEVPIARPNGLNGSLFDMQSVQVLKGPQGTLFGRNTTGGAVLFTPNAPTNEFTGTAQVTGGNYSLWDVEGMINVPFSDAIQLRVAGKVTQRDGYMKNVTPGFEQEASDVDNEAYRVSLALKPTDTLTSTFIGSYFHASDGGTAFKVRAADPALVPVPALRPTFATLANRALNTGDYEYEGTPVTDNSGRQIPLFSRTNAKQIQNTTTWEISDHLLLKNIASYRDVNAEGEFDPSGMPMTLVKTLAFTNMEQITEELQLQGSSEHLNWVTGLFYFREKGNDGSPSNQFSPQLTFTSNADLIKNASKSVFAHADYKLPWAPKWTLSGGLRWTRDDRLTVSHYRRAVPGSVTTWRCLDGTTVTNSFDGVACPTFSGSADFSKVTYDANINYAFTDHTTAYVAHRRGYRSGAVFSRPISVAALGEPTDPEILTDYEVGLKSDFGSGFFRGRANIAAFHGKLEDAQRIIVTTDPNGIIGSAYVNAAKATIDGAEIDATLLIGTQWSLDASFSIIDAQYDKFTDQASNGVAIDVSDSQFSYTPKRVWSVTGRYELPLPSTVGTVTLQANYYHQTRTASDDINTSNCGPGGIYRGCLNKPWVYISGYGLLNLRVDWSKILDSNFDLALFVNNATDKYYYAANHGQFFNQIGTAAALPGPPRMYGAQLRYSF